jgi:uncharacterized protein YndB with AHSA1/START domain
MDFITAVGAVRRAVVATTHDGQPARMVVAERSYDADMDDVWDALTNPQRIPRWFLPISGDLRVGGRYQLEGQAGGTITACEPPRHLAVTWEYGGEVSWVEVHLNASGDTTTFRLEHIAPVDDDKWNEFGPGAVGVGWDLTVVALAEHLETGEQVVPDLANHEALDFMRASSDDWCRASIDAGTPADKAMAAATRTTAAYTGG